MAEDEAEQLPLSPREAAMPPRNEIPAKAKIGMPSPAPKAPQPPEAEWTPPPAPRPNYFEKMLPGESRNPPPPPGPELARDDSIPRVPEMDSEPAANEPHEDEIVPAAVLKAYKVKKMEFGPDYILPKPFDPRLIERIPAAIIKAVKKGK